MVGYTNNLEGERDVERAARNAAAGTADGSRGRIVETRSISLKGAGSKLYVIELVANGRTLQIHTAFFLTRDRLYNVSWTGLKEAVSEKEIANFMASFRLNSN